MPKYAFKVQWSQEDEEWVGLCVEFPSLSWLENNPVAALQGIYDLVEEVIADMLAEGETLPEAQHAELLNYDIE